MEQTRHECFRSAWVLWPSSMLLLLMLSSSAGSSASQFGTPTAESTTDRLSLRSFKTLLSDPSGALASWDNASLHFCRWRGVTCRTHGGEPRVTGLKLESLQVEGKLSPSLANLTFLRRLRLGSNSLAGSIPQELGFLSHLRTLNLSNNHLGGMIPTSLFQNCSRLQIFSLSHNNMKGTIPRNLGNCSELQLIGLDQNMLQGDIPTDLGSLPKLRELVMWNNLLQGGIPPEIGNLASLTGLYLGGNQLTGAIPAAVGNLSSLAHLDLSNSTLVGAIPAAVWNLTSLRQLMLWSNKLTGAIPSDIGNLVSLTILSLHYNQLSGTIPSEIGNLVNLTLCFLGGNHLVGTIPKSFGSLPSLDALILGSNELQARNAAEWSFLDSLANCTHLRKLDISNNDLSAMLPKSIANLSRSLEELDIGGNQIAGSIAEEIGNLISLTKITMWNNLLGGAIPATLGRPSGLVLVKLGGNLLVGEIPATLGNLTRLDHLNLGSNELHGSVPPSLGKCPLNFLDLASNRLNGTVPVQIFYIPTLTQLNISGNLLTGVLPSEIGNLRNTQSIDASDNRLSGRLPSGIAECQVLEILCIRGNYFQGPIPSSFSQLKGLRVLDISSNDLSGHIPDFLGRFNMTFLNLSYNNLDGEVPKDGIFANASAFSVVGNRKLCGGIPELGLPSCPSEEKSSSAKLIAIVSVVGGILCVTFLISLLVARYRLRKSSRLSSVASCINEQHRRVSFAELLRATNEFSPANLIGVGSFGSVYRGIMDWEDHKDVAVKVLNLQQTGAVRSFMAECEALRNVRHRNLVKILTSCSGVDFGGNDFKALVFEFLPNGSLDEWLHPPERDERGSSRTLSLRQRLNISIDVASALDYLHHHVPTPIVHCDLKPSNVLLDDDMVACVGDFGLARFVGKSSERWTNSVTLKGSIGYAAPEYGMGHKVSVQGDVYSCGMLLLEMFTAKRPTDDRFKEGLNLHHYVERALAKHVVEIIDPNLLSGEGEAEAVDCIASVLRVGVLCSKGSPKERMQTEDVIRELHNIKDAFLGSTLLREQRYQRLILRL
ncbi:LRR receptor-like serine threonine-protein kinase [Musa troglodytarum]|uniref:Receptor kinase-like protein Xa21 n=1 Tax=Musa troglodytarum TaxID=320322 RepID=A0A9E7FU52_9LILI|nr:LRR receptor-like serine threonine-protein kinase [Musa troglodytarum]